MKICIVSPHLDDAILSCGILMQRRLAAGDEILALNIFTEGTNAEKRRVEEADAEACIGARPYFLNELDAPDRDPIYKKKQNLFFGPVEDTPEDFMTRVTGRVKDFLAEHGVEAAWFPLGAGGHIDHCIAHEIGRRITGLPVRFYEDRPYILWNGVLQGRMNQLGIAAGLPAVTAESMQASLDDIHYTKSFMPAGEYRDECLPLYYARLAPPVAAAWKGESESRTATEGELRRLYEALSLYKTQMPLIYADYNSFTADSLSHEKARTNNAAYVERCWALSLS